MVNNVEDQNVPLVSTGVNSMSHLSGTPEYRTPPEVNSPGYSTPSQLQSAEAIDEEAANWRELFPCQYPVNPHMRAVGARFNTFDRRWRPSGPIRATTSQIAKAGFYYQGIGDKVKCWYCNGGLQHWERDDDPWTEHAKWFPTCDYLLQSKGPDYVNGVVARFPNLDRPVLRSPFDVTPPESQRRFAERRSSSPSHPPQIIDPQQKKREVREAVKKELESHTVQTALGMHYQPNTVRRCLKKKYERDGKFYESLLPLVNDLTFNEYSSDSEDEKDKEAKESKVKQVSAAACHDPPSTSNLEKPVSYEKRVQELEEQRVCKVCLDKEANVVFVPCGHLCTCMDCAGSLTKCPICRARIEKAIRTYVS